MKQSPFHRWQSDSLNEFYVSWCKIDVASEERGKRERVQAAVNQPDESCKSHSGHLGDVAEDK